MEQLQLSEYQERKQRIKERLNQTVENFIVIGYELRQIRDTESYRMDGYSSLVEFAKAEFNLGKDTVSRFISISIKLTVDGEGTELLPELKGMGYSKLQDVLQLPPDDYQLLTPKTTVKEIRSLKEFNHGDATKERREVPPAETILTPLRRCIRDFFSDPGHRGLLNEVIKEIHAPDYGEAHERKIAEDINPSGTRTHQKGLIYLFMYDYNRGISYKQMGKPQPVSMGWHEFLEEISATFAGFTDESGETWCNVFGTVPEEDTADITGQMNIIDFQEKKKEAPTEKKAVEKEKVATSQQQKKEKEAPQKKKPDPKLGMDEEELAAVQAAAVCIAECNPALRELPDYGRSLDNALLQLAPVQASFQAQGKTYALKLTVSSVQAECEEHTYRWNFGYFATEVSSYLLKLEERKAQEETVPAEEIREVVEEPEKQEDHEEDMAATMTAPEYVEETPAAAARETEAKNADYDAEKDDMAAVAQDAEEDIQAAVVHDIPMDPDQEGEDLVSLWEEAKLAEEKLHLLFGDWEFDTIKTETLKTVYRNAITIAANMERIMAYRGIQP